MFFKEKKLQITGLTILDVEYYFQSFWYAKQKK